MAPNKFEKDIKNKLETREIMPSAEAWDRLDAMLTVSEKPKKKFPWFLVAASFIGFVFLITFFANKNNEFEFPNNQNSVVNQNKKLEINSEKNVQSDIIIKSNSQEKVVLNNVNQKTNTVQNRVSIIKNNQSRSNGTILKNVQIAHQEIVVELPSNEVKKLELIANQTTIEKPETLNFNPEILNSQPHKIKINASTLLSQVDDEVRNEYQQTIFQKIGTNFQAVKVAFNERNLKK